MFCSKCGKEVKEGAKFCGACGSPTGVAANQQQSAPPSQASRVETVRETSHPIAGNMGNFTPPNADQTKSWLMADAKCIPAFVLGLVAGIMGIMGGYCTTACNGIASSSAGNAAFGLIFIPSVIGLIGACICYKHARIGSLLMFIPGVTIIIKGWFMYGGAEFMSIFAMLLFWVGGIVGLALTWKRN